jgi:hypothetical protein
MIGEAGSICGNDGGMLVDVFGNFVGNGGKGGIVPLASGDSAGAMILEGASPGVQAGGAAIASCRARIQTRFSAAQEQANSNSAPGP